MWEAAKSFRFGLAVVLACVFATPCFADTVLGVTEVSYDAAWRPVCTAVRMNPATFTATAGVAIQPAGGADTGACARTDGGGSYGPDRITFTRYDDAGRVREVKRAYGTGLVYSYARYTYSSNGLKTSELDGDGNRTQYVYDGFDRLQFLYYPTLTGPKGDSDPDNPGVGVNSNDFEQFG